MCIYVSAIEDSDFIWAAPKYSSSATFPVVIEQGSFSHFTQNIWKISQANGFQERYEQGIDFVTHVPMIAAMAFLLEYDVDSVFNVPTNNNNDADLDIILENLYFSSMLVKGVIRRFSHWILSLGSRVRDFKGLKGVWHIFYILGAPFLCI